MIPSSDWLDEAACSVFELDTNLFFERQSGRVRAAVQQICRECPVRKQCLEIYLLPGWEDSRGARLEKQIADALGIKEVPTPSK